MSEEDVSVLAAIDTDRMIWARLGIAFAAKEVAAVSPR